MSQETHNELPLPVIDRAVKLSCIQSMLSAMYVALCGGMFIIGFALKLKADDRMIGLITTIPMLCVVAQLVSSVMVEKGLSRRKLTIWTSILGVAGWPLIAAIPFLFKDLSYDLKLWLLIGLITLMSVFGMFAGNVRSSWVGDLIPAARRGEFFGKMLTFSGVISAVMGVIGGSFLDYAKKAGTGAFSLLFIVGMVCGLAVAFLYIPQADVQTQTHGPGVDTKRMISETFKNKPFMVVTLYAIVWSLQAIAGPFVSTYMLRDLKISYFGLGAINAVSTVFILASSAFWGRMMDKYGCKPVIILCTALIVPIPFEWIWINTALAAYIILPILNIAVGFATAGISVALSTLIYNVTPTKGRSMQFAIYSIIVTLLAAPMPAIGGMMPGWIKALGIHTDLRCTFYATQIFTFASFLIALKIPESGAHSVKEMSRGLRSELFRNLAAIRQISVFNRFR